MKEYVEPEIEIIEFSIEDIALTAAQNDDKQIEEMNLYSLPDIENALGWQ